MSHSHDSPESVNLPPTVVTLLLAEGIHLDRTTGKHYILGVLGKLRNPSYPVVLPDLACFIECTDARGSVSMQLRVVDVDEAMPPVITLNFTYQFLDPVGIQPMHFFLKNLLIPQAGDYRVQLLCNGIVLRERRLLALGTHSDQPPA